MPAKTPDTGTLAAAQLTALGERIRAHRKRLKVSATTAAEAAGMSRVTLHRIERGEPSVTMGAYLGALQALGLELQVSDPREREAAAKAAAELPERIRIDAYPELKRLAWQADGATELTPSEALSVYERNWRHIDVQRLDGAERALIDALVAGVGKGRPLV
jgi:transcriptional regulator with XRE-family HTH domain